MGAKCCVRGCRGNYDAKNKVSLFYFPKNEERKKLWLSKIHRDNFSPSGKAGVCERHFVESFIIRIDSVVNDNGTVSNNPRKAPKLTAGAFPTILPGDSSWKEFTKGNRPPDTCVEFLKNEMAQGSSVNSMEKSWEAWNWKQEYLRVSKTIDHLQDLARINVDLLELGFDLDNFPEAKDEIKSVRKLTEGVRRAKEIRFDFASQDLYTKMRYLDEQLTDMFSILTDQEFKSAFAGLMEMELTNICAFPAFLDRLVTVKNNPSLETISLQFDSIADEQTNTAKNPKVMVLVKPDPDRDGISEVDTIIENDDRITTAVSDATSANQPSQNLTRKKMLPFGFRQLPMCTPKNELTSNKQKKKKRTQDKGGGNAKRRGPNVMEEVNKLLDETPAEIAGENKLVCPICKLVFANSYLKRHIVTVHWRKKSCLCPECGKILNCRESLEAHLLTHISDRKYDCDVCSKSFKCLKSFKKHKLLHKRFPDGDGKIHACSECPKRFLMKSQLHVHQRMHTGERPYLCSQCPNRFISKQTLARHFANIHNGMRRKKLVTVKLKTTTKNFFKCSLCDEVRTYHHTMSYHILKHPEHIRDCAVCDETFESTADLHAHVKSTHLEDKPFQCTICSENFYSQYLLALHKAHHDPKKSHCFKCSLCDKSFTRKELLGNHRRYQHSGWQKECEICKKIYRNPSDLSKHRRTHGERKYKCNICEKAFASLSVLQSHLWTHMKTKKHKCEQCDRGFNDKRHLKFHIQKFHSSSNPTDMGMS